MDQKFDNHMSLQQESFLQAGLHDQAKKHGKLRTKFDRLLVAMHLLHTYCSAYCQAKRDANFNMLGALAVLTTIFASVVVLHLLPYVSAVAAI